MGREARVSTHPNMKADGWDAYFDGRDVDTYADTFDVDAFIALAAARDRACKVSGCDAPRDDASEHYCYPHARVLSQSGRIG